MKTPILFALASSLLVSGSLYADIDTVWNFNGNLDATNYGSDQATMSWRGNTGTNAVFYGSEHDLGLPMPYGDNTGVLFLPKTDTTQGLRVDISNGGAPISEYTVTWDIFRPGQSWNQWSALLQTNTSNTDDSEFFINKSGAIGANSIYNGKVTSGVGASGTQVSQQPSISWNRITMTYSGGSISKYVDGTLVGTHNISKGVYDSPDARYSIQDAFLMFADNDGETSDIYLGSVRFADRVLSSDEIRDLGTVHAGGAATPGVQMTGNPADFKPGSFTIAIMGDIQNYVSNGNNTNGKNYYSALQKEVEWLVANKEARNIQYVIQTGDLVNTATNTAEWDRATTALDTLNGVIPYSVVRGNHDGTGNDTKFDNRFGPDSGYGRQDGIVGFTGGGESASMRNTYQTVDISGSGILIMNLDISAKQDVLDWAKQVIGDHAEYRVILNMHAYMSDGGERFDSNNDAERGKLVGHDESKFNGTSYGGFDGEFLWENLVSQYANIFMVVSGHQFENYDQFKYKLDTGVNGNTVYQLMVNQQVMADGGDGYLRLLEFDPDNETVRVKTYSPYLDRWDTAPDVYYNIKIDPLLIPEPSSLMTGAAGLLLLLLKRRK